MHLTMDPQLAKLNQTSDQDLFNHLMALQGHVYRELEGRRTQRIELQGQGYFLKQHYGIGWREIFKNLLQGRLPVIGAKNEWRALQRLHALSVPTLTLMAYGQRGYNPARTESFLLTRELTGVISLEDLCRDWPVHAPAPRVKWALIAEVARLMRILHLHGINHRDCYLCHFLLDEKTAGTTSPRLYVIDLHRAQLRTVTPRRWVIKDLAGLYFSSKDIGLTSRDWLRFIREYRQQALHTVLANEGTFWHKVEQRGNRTYRKHGQS